MSMSIIKITDPGKLRAYVVRHGGTPVGTTGDMWRTFLSANGGSGRTFYSLEKSWLSGQGYTSFGALAAASGCNEFNRRDALRHYIDIG